MLTQAEANRLKQLADQWAQHAALAAHAYGYEQHRHRKRRREEMKSRFLYELQSLTEKTDANS